MAEQNNRHRNRPSVSVPAGGLSQRLLAWRENHALVASQSLRRLLDSPISSAMTLLVLAIAITLPAAVNIAVANFATLTGQANDTVQMTLYLEPQVSDQQAQSLANSIAGWAGVEQTAYISPQQARASMSTIDGFESIIDSLPSNPLPGAVIVNLSEQSLTVEAANQLKTKALALDTVALAKIDLEWLQKVRAIIKLAEQLAAGLSLLLSVGVVLVVGNTIKLAIDNRRDEIIVTKLVGGTNAFIRRPFLYTGLWFGLGGSMLALLLLIASKQVLGSSVDDISQLYDTHIAISGLTISTAVKILLSGALLGWLGAWLAASRHISALEPR